MVLRKFELRNVGQNWHFFDQGQCTYHTLVFTELLIKSIQDFLNYQFVVVTCGILHKFSF